MSDNLVTRPAGRSIREADPMNAGTIAAHLYAHSPAYARLRVTTSAGGSYAVITCENSHQFALRSDRDEYAYGATDPQGNSLDGDGLQLGSALDAYDGLRRWAMHHAMIARTVDSTTNYKHPDEVTP